MQSAILSQDARVNFEQCRQHISVRCTLLYLQIIKFPLIVFVIRSVNPAYLVCCVKQHVAYWVLIGQFQ